MEKIYKLFFDNGNRQKRTEFSERKINKRGELSDHLSFLLQSSLWTVT